MNPPPVILREWIENKVTGFISTSELEAALTASAVGTFMIRFSENVKGAVTMQFKVQSKLDIQKLLKLMASWNIRVNILLEFCQAMLFHTDFYVLCF